jgi:hypothetical protein
LTTLANGCTIANKIVKCFLAKGKGQMYQIIIDGVLCKEQCRELEGILPWVDIVLTRGAKVVELMYNFKTIEVFY